MSIEAYEEMLETTQIDTAINGAEREFAAGGELTDAGDKAFWINIVNPYSRAYRDLDGIYTYIANNY